MINHLKALLLLGSVVGFMLLMKIKNIFHFLESIFLWLKHCQETLSNNTVSLGLIKLNTLF